jgi:hypothetical protein
MTRHRRIEDAITEWLEEEAPNRLPEWALESALERARGSRQRLAVPGWRWYTMPRILPWAAGLAATAVIAFLVVGALGQGPGDPSGAGGVPSSSASRATASLLPSSPSPDPSEGLQTFAGVRPLEGVVGKLEPGTYSVSSIEPLEIRFTVPRGWEVPPRAPEFVGPTGQDGREIGGLSFWAPTLFYADPCRSDGKFIVELPADASVDAVVSRLTTLWDSELSVPKAATVSGFNGKYASATAAPCGAETRYWVLDVSGQTLIVIAHVWPESSPAEAAELQGIVDSVQIERP